MFIRRSFILRLILGIPFLSTFVIIAMLFYGNDEKNPVSYEDHPKNIKPNLAKLTSGTGVPGTTATDILDFDDIDSVDDPALLERQLQMDEFLFDHGDDEIEDQIPETVTEAMGDSGASIYDPNHPIYKENDPNQPGHLGVPVKIDMQSLNINDQKLWKDGLEKHSFNQYISDTISVYRSLPQHPFQTECQAQIPDPTSLSDLSTSVIICFHNEAWSVLLRTVHSILNRTPANLLKEIILVDDFSYMPHLKQPLEEYMAKYRLIRIVRLPDRRGLIKARLKGAELATGNVLTFMDSHCECMENWLQPLLARLIQNPESIVCPMIDTINSNTFAYEGLDKDRPIYVGDFDWSMDFDWHTVNQTENRSPVDPVKTPVMAGGIFSVMKSIFERLGTYDPGLDIWGAENLELSFKVWMCGNGSLEIVPCSRVGHVFRVKSPYSWRKGVNVLRKNKIRVAEVWLDEYKEYFYDRINNQLGAYGDVTDRKILKKSLQCKSFKWYLENVFPELTIPGPVLAKGELRNFATKRGQHKCLESHTRKHSKTAVKARKCTEMGEAQFWTLSLAGEIRRDESCLTFNRRRNELFAKRCRGSENEQMWKYDHNEHRVIHVGTGRCLETAEKGSKLILLKCMDDILNQQWIFQHYFGDHANATEVTVEN